MKGLIVSILSDGSPICGLNRVSSKSRTALLVSETKQLGPFEDDGELPVIKLAKGHIHGTVRAVLVNHDDRKERAMFGGCFIHDCDGRYARHIAEFTHLSAGVSSAVPLHDRYE